MAGTSSPKTRCALVPDHDAIVLRRYGLLITDRSPDALRKRVLRLIGKGAAVVGQERIALTNAAASGDRRSTLLDGREAAESYSATNRGRCGNTRRGSRQPVSPSQPKPTRSLQRWARQLFSKAVSSFSLCVGFQFQESHMGCQRYQRHRREKKAKEFSWALNERTKCTCLTRNVV